MKKIYELNFDLEYSALKNVEFNLSHIVKVAYALKLVSAFLFPADERPF